MKKLKPENELLLVPPNKIYKSDTMLTQIAKNDASMIKFEELSRSQRKFFYNYQSELYQAVTDNDLKKLIEIKDLHSDELPSLNIYSKLLTRNGKFPNVLYKAIENGKTEIAQYLIEFCPKEFLFQSYINISNQVPPSNKNCLHLLAELGNTVLFEKFLKKLRSFSPPSDSGGIQLKGMFVNLDDRFTIEGVPTEERVKAFLNSRFVYKIDKTTKRRFSALHVASFNDRLDIVRLLLEYPPDDSNKIVDVDICDNENETALFWAVKKRLLNVFRLLIRFGANVNCKNKAQSYPIHVCVVENCEDMLREMFNIEDLNLNAERVKSPRDPIAIAAHENRPHLVKLLLSRNSVIALPEKRIKEEHVHESLMIAIINGNSDIIKIILAQNPDLVNRSDKFGNTPLMLATLNGNKDIFTMLFKLTQENEKYKEDKLFKTQNNMNQTIFDLAMIQSNFEILGFLVDYKRDMAENVDLNELFYLQKAAAKDDIEKFEFLVSRCKINLLTVDENNECFAHVAAYYDSYKLLDKFIKVDDDITEVQNSFGETALHVAVRRSNADSVKVLLSKNPRLDFIDNDGQTILHAALSDKNLDYDIIKLLIDAIDAKPNSQSILNAQDSFGDTALHIAAKHKHHDVIPLFGKINFACENKEGETALHKACQYGTIDEMRAILDLFTSDSINKNKRLIDHKDESGQSALFAVARKADIEKFEVLMEYGVDLAIASAEGYNFIYALIDGMADSTEETTTYFSDFFVRVVRQCVRWYCKKEFITTPLENSPKYLHIRYKALRLLLVESNFKSYNAIQYAAYRKTILPILILRTPGFCTFDVKYPIFNQDLKLYQRDNVTNFDEVICLPKHYKNLFKDKDSMLYDITGLIPRTFNFYVDKDEVGNTTRRSSFQNKNLAANTSEINLGALKSNESLIEIVLNTRDKEYIHNILNKEPFYWLVINYWKFCRRGYECFMWFHVTYMLLFTYLLIPTKHWIRERFFINETNFGEYQMKHEDEHRAYILFLIWPSLILLYELISLIVFLYVLYFYKIKNRNKDTGNTQENKRKKLDFKLVENINDVTSGMMRLPIGVLFFILHNLSHFSSIIFGVSTIGWFFLFFYSTVMHYYLNCLALVFIVGWMHTINYVKGFKDWSTLANIFKQIIENDMTRFVYIYVFVLISFGYAFHVMVQADITNDVETSSANTIYLTFLRMITGDVQEISEQAGYKDSVSSLVILKIICTCYAVLSSVVLMNMLIAMMNSTYSKIETNVSFSWRIESIQMMIMLEKLFYRYFNVNLLLRFKHIHDSKNNKWFHENVPSKVDNWIDDNINFTIDANLDEGISENGKQVTELKKTNLDSNISELKEEIEELKKEKSTDCDSALIPLHCVHG